MRRLVDAIILSRGVIAVILFGSVARGDSDKFSDFDLLIVFEDKASLWREWDGLFDRVGSLRLNVNAIPQTADELRSANPVFLDELNRTGRVLFSRAPFEVSLLPFQGVRSAIVTYDLAGLAPKEKMRIIYELYEKGGKGLVGAHGGSRLGSGCVIVPDEVGAELVEMLRSRNARVSKIEVFVEPRAEPDHRRVVKNSSI